MSSAKLIILSDDPSIRDDLRDLLEEGDHMGARILLDMAYEEDICCRVHTQLPVPEPKKPKIKNLLEAKRRAFKAHEKQEGRPVCRVEIRPTPKGQLIAALKDHVIGDPKAQVEALTRVIHLQDHRKGLALELRQIILDSDKGLPVGMVRDLVNRR